MYAVDVQKTSRRTLGSDDGGEPARHGQHDRIGDEIASEHPGGFVLSGAQAAGNAGRAALAMEESSTSMNIANVTVRSITHGL